MILEMAHIEVKPGAEAAFEAAVAQVAPLFAAARGCQQMELHRVVETPSQYLLMVHWTTLEDHTVHFRNSDAFQQWRALAGPHFASSPDVRHTAIVLRGWPTAAP